MLHFFLQLFFLILELLHLAFLLLLMLRDGVLPDDDILIELSELFGHLCLVVLLDASAFQLPLLLLLLPLVFLLRELRLFCCFGLQVGLLYVLSLSHELFLEPLDLVLAILDHLLLVLLDFLFLEHPFLLLLDEFGSLALEGLLLNPLDFFLFLLPRLFVLGPFSSVGLAVLLLLLEFEPLGLDLAQLLFLDLLPLLLPCRDFIEEVLALRLNLLHLSFLFPSCFLLLLVLLSQ